LTERVALNFWRLRRVVRHEASLINQPAWEAFRAIEDGIKRMQGDDIWTDAKKEEHRGLYAYKIDAVSVPDQEALQKISRYEAALERSLYRAMHELEAMQERRKGRAAPLARVQVHGLNE
jgi:hypothetical protein